MAQEGIKSICRILCNEADNIVVSNCDASDVVAKFGNLGRIIATEETVQYANISTPDKIDTPHCITNHASVYTDLFVRACAEPTVSFMNREFLTPEKQAQDGYQVFAWTDSTPNLGNKKQLDWDPNHPAFGV